MTAATLALVVLAAASPADRFRQANEAARSGDAPKAIAGYTELAAAGAESASLYWNWAQVSAARGATGEALWALLRARELEPGDAAVSREITRLRESANLDPAETSPEPLHALGRWSRRLHLSLLALILAAVSLVAHAAARLWDRGPQRSAFVAALLAVACLLGALPLAASYARPTGVVVRRAAPLLDAASPTAEPVGTLREGEVVPILEDAGGLLRLEDSSGARGWASGEDVWRLDRAAAPLAGS